MCERCFTIIDWLLEKDAKEVVARNLGQFEELDTKTAKWLIEAGYGQNVLDNVHFFTEEDQPDIADLLIEAGFADGVFEHRHDFEHFNLQAAKRLIDMGYIEQVAANVCCFYDREEAEPVKEGD